MSDPERLERYLQDFGARLSAAAAAAGAAPRARSRRRWRAAAVAITVTVAAVVAVALAASGERALDPVAEARAALDPPGEIVYMKITTTARAADAGVPPPQTTEQWSALDPPRWRFVQHLTTSSGRVGSVVKGRFVPLTGRSELSYAHGVLRSYLAAPDTLHVTRGYRDDGSAARPPSVLGVGSGDPTVDLRSMLLQGSVSDRGEQQLRGRTVRRFVVEQGPRSANDPPLVRRMVYDVDPRTFAPIEGRLTLTFGTHRGLRRPERITSTMHVDAYRRIPLTAATAKLLKLTITPNTKATFDTAQRLQARNRAWRARCHPIQHGRALACPAPDGPKRPGG